MENTSYTILYSNLLKTDELAEEEIGCILEGKNNPNILMLVDEVVVLLDVYEEFKNELQKQKSKPKNNVDLKKCFY